MKQRNDSNCGCFNNLFDPQQKWFLTRKNQAEELQPSPNFRRKHNPSDVKEEALPKSKKKSLKKRSNSNGPLNNHLATQEMEEMSKVQSPTKINFEGNNFNSHPQFSFSRTIEAPFIRETFSPLVFKNQEHQRMNASFIEQLNDLPIPNIPHISSHHYRSVQQKIPRHEIPTTNHDHYEQQPYLVIANNQLKRQAQQTLSPFKNKIEVPKLKEETPNNLIHKIHHPTKYNQQETESWIPVREDSLIIQEFNRLFKNKEEHQSHQNLNQEHKPHIKAREAKKSKRIENQQLFGRFAESDQDQAASDVASQVIGKGFQSHFQKYNDFDQAYHIEETMATRSTNTKFSQLNKREASQQNYKPKFGVGNHKSYKYL